MPKKKQYEDVLTSVYDFVFEQAKKKPAKVKPLKVTGVDGTSEFTEAMIAMLENPVMFVNNNTMEAFKEISNIDIATMQVGQRATDKIKFNINDLQKLLSDPNAIDKQFAKIEAIRKTQRLMTFGEDMKGVLAGAWAYKNGLDKDAVMGLFYAGQSTASPLRTDTATVGMVPRYKKLADKYLAPGSKEIDEESFKSFFGEANYKLYQSLRGRELKGDKQIEEFFQNKSVYGLLESMELYSKSEGKSPELREKYQSASRFLVNTGAFSNLRGFLKQADYRKKQIYSSINELKKSEGNQGMIDDLRKELKELNSFSKTARAFDLGSRLGEAEAAFYTYKDYLSGGMLPAIINGNFFDPGRNSIKWLMPTEMKNYHIKGDFLLRGVHMARKSDSKYAFVRGVTNNVYEKLNGLYYLSPVTWVKSLYTGEIFAHRMAKNMDKFEHLMNTRFKNLELKFSDKFWGAFAKGGDNILGVFDGSIAPEKLASLLGPNYASMDAEFFKILKDPLAKEQFMKFMQKDSKWRNLTHMFSGGQRLKEKIANKLNELVGNAFRKRIGETLLKIPFVQKYAAEAVGRWILKGGIQTLVKGIASAAGSAFGPLGTVVGFIVTQLAMDLVYKLAKPFAKFVVTLIRFFLLFIVGAVAAVILFIAVILGQFSHVAPNQAVKCEAFVPEPYDIGSENTGIWADPTYDGPIFSGSINQIYDQVAASMGVGTNLELVDCPGHPACEQIGDAWCYSGSKVFCKGAALGGASSDTLSRLFAHELYHQIQAVNSGGAESIVREWGADLLTGNGGSYRFCVNGSKVTATSTKQFFISLGCTEQELKDLAVNKESAVRSTCGSKVLNTLNWCPK